jgi:hypothetical protein
MVFLKFGTGDVFDPVVRSPDLRAIGDSLPNASPEVQFRWVPMVFQCACNGTVGGGD